MTSCSRPRAAERGITLTAFVEEALTATLLPRPRGEKPFELRWNTHRGRLRPGVDLNDRDSLYDVMEGCVVSDAES